MITLGILGAFVVGGMLCVVAQLKIWKMCWFGSCLDGSCLALLVSFEIIRNHY